MPTVQISSAIVSAIQVQETIKLICGHPVASGKKIYFQGTVNDFDVLSLSHNPDCLAHAEFPRVVSLPLGTDCTLKEFIVMVSKSDYSGEGASLDFNGDMTASLSRTFIKSVSCRTCKKPIDFYRPSFRINENETICSSCQEGGNKEKDTTFDVESDKVSISRFNISATEDRVLNMTLRDIGVPYQHIVAVYDTGGVYQYYELAGDKNKILPEVTRDIIQITLDK
jgi:adenylyltransferase/sulfurtransferase